MSTLTRARCRARAHPAAVDTVLAVGVLLCMVAGSFVEPHDPKGVSWGLRTPDPLSLVLMALGAAALVFRRRAPRTVLGVTGGLSVVESVTGDPRAPVAMCAVIALYTVAASTDRPTTWRLGLLTMTVLTGTAMAAGPLPWYAQENLAILAWTGIGATAGDAVRSRRAFVQAIRERAERAERTREEEARRRVAEERLRIARDLHDVVAHHIALVNVQAGVAAHVMDKRPDQAKEALAHVREASRHALGELRATVGLLRQSGDPEAPTEPAPGLDRLDELAATFRNAGLRVEVARADQGTELPAAVGLAAYRIVQEALTNVQKHAGAARAPRSASYASDRTSRSPCSTTAATTDTTPPPAAGTDCSGCANASPPCAAPSPQAPASAAVSACMRSCPSSPAPPPLPAAARDPRPAGARMTIRVLLADDQALLRSAFRVLVDSEPDMEVVGEASDGAEAVRLARAHRPDVVLMDIRMPGTDGLAATREISADPALDGVRVVILTTFEVDDYVVQSLRAGASGFLGKGSEPEEMLNAVRIAAGGEALLSPQATKGLIARFLAQDGPPGPDLDPERAERLDSLTVREREVLVQVAGGHSNDEIAERLEVSPLTVKTHVNRAMAKLGARDRAQLVVIAYESGLVRPRTDQA